MTEAKQADLNQPELKKSKKARNTSPRDLQILTDQDQETLKQLQSALSSTGSRNLRGKQLKTFSDMINIIQKFCIRGDAYDWRRCFVCGICWLNNGIAINNRRFGCLLGKCKSSINGSFQQLGYTTAPSRSESYDSIVEAIPILKNDMPSLREWTLRIRNTNNITPAQAAAAVNVQGDDNTQNGSIIDAQTQQPIHFQPLPDTQDIQHTTPQQLTQDPQVTITPQPFSVQSMPQTTNTTAELQAVASFNPDSQNYQQMQQQPLQILQPVIDSPSITPVQPVPSNLPQAQAPENTTFTNGQLQETNQNEQQGSNQASVDIEATTEAA